MLLFYTDKRKRKRDLSSESRTPQNVFVRSGSVIGVYFEPESGKTPMPIIGSQSSGSHEICKQLKYKNATSINCTSSFVSNLLIHALAEISKWFHNIFGILSKLAYSYKYVCIKRIL